MKRQPVAVRVLSGCMALAMFIQPVLAAVPSLNSTRQIEEGLIGSGLFQNADAREAESLGVVWGDYLSTFAARAEDLRAFLAFESRLSEAMRQQLTAWAEVRAEFQPEGDDAVKLAASVQELDGFLRVSLDRREDMVRELNGQVEVIADTARQLERHETAEASVFVTAYEFDMTARLLESEHGLADRAWNALVLGQVGFLEAVEASDEQITAALTPLEALAESIEAEPGVLSRWDEARAALDAAFVKPRREINWQREAAILDAARRLAGSATEGLRDKADANSRAHAAIVERFAAIVEQRMDQLASLTTEPGDGLRESSFLQPAEPATLQGEWAAHGRRHQEIGRELVDGLGEADRILEQQLGVALRVIGDARGVIGTIARTEAPDRAETFAPLRRGLMQSQDELDRYEKALRDLDDLRTALREQAADGDKQAFEQANLRNREEAVAYAKLGQVYEAAHALMLGMRMEIGGIQSLVAATQSLGIETQVADLNAGAEDFDTHLSRWGGLAETQRQRLEQLRQLAMSVASDYTRDFAAFAETLEAAVAAHEGPYAKVLASMQARTKRGADALSGLAAPLLEALGGDDPRVSAPVLTWSGTVSLQGAIKRSIGRGSYFRTTGENDLAALGKAEDFDENADISTMMALVDLAIAIDYPVRTFVAPEGMAIIVGGDGPGVIIRGIGNIEKYRLDPKEPQGAKEPQGSIIRDFSSHGVLVGWDWGGAFQNFVQDAGQALGDAAGAIGRAAGDVAQGVQQFGAQVVETVGPAVSAFAQNAVEVGGFIVDTAAILAEDIWNNPIKLLEYAAYGIAIAGTVVLTVATKGLASPLLIATLKYVGKQVAFDLGKAGAKAAVRREYIDDATGKSMILAINVGHTLTNIHHLSKSVKNIPRTIRGLPKMLRGVTPTWTVGLPSTLRDVAHVGAMSWKTARQLNFWGNVGSGYKAMRALGSIVVSLTALWESDTDAPETPPSVAPIPPSGERESDWSLPESRRRQSDWSMPDRKR